MTDNSSYQPYNRDHIPPMKRPQLGGGDLNAFDPSNLEFTPYHIHNGLDSPKISASNLIGSANDWQFTGLFSASSSTQVSWTSGTLTTRDGTSYTISSGSTGTMSGLTYIYFDSTASTTLQSTTDPATAVGDGKVLIGVANVNGNGSDGGSHPMGITFSPDKTFIYVSGNSATRKYDINFNLLATNATLGASSGVTAPNITSDANFLYIADGAKVYKLNADDLTSALNTSLTIDGVTISPDGLYLYGVDSVNSKLYKLNTSDLTQAVTAANTGANPISVGVSPSGATVYVRTIGGGLGGMQKFTASTLAAGTFTNTSGSGATGSLAVSPDGNGIYATSTTAKVDKFNTSLALTVAGVLSGGSHPLGVTVSTDNSFVYVVDNTANLLYKLNAADLSEAVSHVAYPATPVNLIADANYLYIINSNSTLRRYNASDLTLSLFIPQNAIFQIFGGSGGIRINGSEIAPGSIPTSALISGAIKAKTATFVVGPSSNSDSSTYDYVTDGTDDDVQIQAAIDALPSTGGSICLREGTYTLGSATVTIAKNGVEIFGVGQGTIITCKTSFNKVFFKLGHASTQYYNCIIKDIYFDGNKSASGANDLPIIDNNTLSKPIINATYQQCYFVNIFAGVMLCASSGFDRFLNNYIADWQGSGAGTFAGYCIGGDAICINNNFVASGTNSGVFKGSTIGSGGGIFSNNIVSLPASYNGALITTGFRVSGNEIKMTSGSISSSAKIIQLVENVEGNNISCGASADVSSVGIKAYLNVENNNIINVGTGVTFTSSTVCKVIGNDINVRGHGINVDTIASSTTDAHIVSLNRIAAGSATTNTYSGILISANGIRVVINGNSLSNSSSVVLMRYGIADTGGTNCTSVVTNNIVYNAGTQDILIQTAASIVSNNLTL